MAIPTPSSLRIVPSQGWIQPAMDANPLDTVLQNGNHLYKHFCPPLISFVPIDGPASRTRSYVVAVEPSADGLSYAFEHRILPATTGTVDIKVESNTGVDPTTGWSTIYGPTTTAPLTGAAWATVSHSATIPANARMVRVSYSSATVNVTIGHVLAVPAPSSVTSGIKACGFVPYDGDLLALSGGPVTVELVDRMRTNALAVLRDRRQVIASLVQHQDSSAPWSFGYSAPSAWSNGQPMRLGKSVATLPGQTNVSLNVHVIASVSAGATADLIEVLLGNLSVKLAATGSRVTSSVTVDLPGGAASTLPVEVRVRHTTGNSTYLQSLTILWRPGD